MGIELGSEGFNARCDGCDTQVVINAHASCTVGEIIRHRGWVRVDYIETAHHYVWVCPKCKDLQ